MKIKDYFKKSMKYFRELSIVVIGIAITFAVGDLLHQRSERKNVQNYLNLVHFELGENLIQLKKYTEFYKKIEDLANYLLSDKLENLHRDSLKNYNDVIGRFEFMAYKTSAFEMLKSSGAMGVIKDKEMLRSILESYTVLERLKKENDAYTQKKLDETYENAFNNFVGGDMNILHPKNKRLFTFYALTLHLENACMHAQVQLKATLAKF